MDVCLPVSVAFPEVSPYRIEECFTLTLSRAFRKVCDLKNSLKTSVSGCMEQGST